ncbi:MAG TPA: hypothetical protein VFZ83_03455 [Acidimicrobiia bacterium]|nr:hypothetical protein [Acidimicrobiia bacterium]
MRDQETTRSATRHDGLAWLVAGAALVLVVATIQIAAGGGPSTSVLAAAPASATETDATDTSPTTAGDHDDEHGTTGTTHGDDHGEDHGTTGTTHGDDHGTTGTTHGDDHGTTGTTHGHDTSGAGTSPTTHGHGGGGTTPTTHDHGTTPTTSGGGTPPTTHDHGGGEPVGITPETLAEIDVARQLALQYPTAADAEAAGWHKITVHLPGIAAHYLRGEYLDDKFVLNKPEVLLYGGEGLDAPLVGVNYIVRGSTPPLGFTGDADHWHEHPTLCFNPTLGLIVGDEHVTSAECAALGGNIISFAGNWLLHVWCIPGWEAPEGVFSHENSLVV